jgi:hypothetical protein
MIVYWMIMIAGVVVLALLVASHHQLLPLERNVTAVEWKQHREEVPEGPDRVDVAGDQMIIHCRDGSQLNFRAPGMHLALGALTFVTVNGRRLLAVLDRARYRRTYLIDVYRAAEGGTIWAGLIGWWRHETGYLLAADGDYLIEVHRCFGRDRVYLLDPSRALQGHAFGLGITRTLVAPTRRLGSVALHGREVFIAAGKDRWRASIA